MKGKPMTLYIDTDLLTALGLYTLTMGVVLIGTWEIAKYIWKKL